MTLQRPARRPPGRRHLRLRRGQPAHQRHRRLGHRALDDGTRKYVWGLGLAYAVSGTAIEVQHTDRLGSIRAVSDGTGAVIATYRTDEFGVPTTSTGTAGSPFRYTGEPLDASGLTYLRARHYDASIGRFMSRDPFAGVPASPLSLNRYSYVANNPATWSDPSGLSPSSKVLSGTVSGPVQSRGACLSGQFGVGAYVGSQLCVGIDALDQLAVMISGEVGGVAGGTGSVGVGGFASTAQNLYDVSNLSGVFGGSVGEVLVAGTETSLAIGPDGSTIVTQTGTVGVGFNLGLGLPPVEIHSGLSQTAVFAVDFEELINQLIWTFIP